MIAVLAALPALAQSDKQGVIRAPAAAAPASPGPFDGEWTGTLRPRGGHFVVRARIVGGELVIDQDRAGARVVANGTVDPGGHAELRGNAGDSNTPGASDLEIRGMFVGNTFRGQGRVGTRWAEMQMTRAAPPPPSPPPLPRGAAAAAAPAAPAPAVAATAGHGRFDGTWSGTLRPRGGHYVVSATIDGDALVIDQDRPGAYVVAKGMVGPGGHAELRGTAGDRNVSGATDLEIRGMFDGNVFKGQGRVGDRWAELELTRVSAAPPRAVAAAPAAPPPQAPPPQAPPPQAPPPQAPPPQASLPPPPVAPAAQPAAKPAPSPPVVAKSAPSPQPPPQPPAADQAPPRQTAAVAPRSAPPTAKPAVKPAARAPSAVVPAPQADRKPPAISVPAKLETAGPVVELGGRVVDDSAIIELSVDGRSVPVGPDGRFSVRRGVPLGTSELRLAAVDEWGNIGEAVIPVTRTAPAAAVQTAAAPAKPDPAAAVPRAPQASAPKASASGISEKLKHVAFGRYRAVVIGNNNYRYITKLKTAVKDAQAVAETLKGDYGFQVELLLDATRGQIMTALYRLRGELTESDNLLIYYAGHGVQDKETGRGYWLPVDAQTHIPTEWVPTTDLTNVVKGMRAAHIMVVADSCYSGTLTRSAAAELRTAQPEDVVAWVERMLAKTSRTVLSSGGIEPVLDGGGGEHSVFAKAFIEALRENADVIDGQSLFTSIRRPILLNSDQTPEYSDIRQAGHDGGDFLFVRR